MTPDMIRSRIRAIIERVYRKPLAELPLPVPAYPARPFMQVSLDLASGQETTDGDE